MFQHVAFGNIEAYSLALSFFLQLALFPFFLVGLGFELRASVPTKQVSYCLSHASNLTFSFCIRLYFNYFGCRVDCLGVIL
jgi:hypothetical protein